MSETVTADALQALIDDSKALLYQAERKLTTLKEQMDAVAEDRDALRYELDAIQAAYERRFPSAESGPELELVVGDSDDGKDAIAMLTARYDWKNMSRVYAVERAVEELTARQGEASPDSVQAFLIAQGRVEVRPDIGNALSHLHRTHKIERLGRGRWVPRGLSLNTATAAENEEA